jgi:hypothetical protein
VKDVGAVPGESSSPSQSGQGAASRPERGHDSQEMKRWAKKAPRPRQVRRTPIRGRWGILLAQARAEVAQVVSHPPPEPRLENQPRTGNLGRVRSEPTGRLMRRWSAFAVQLARRTSGSAKQVGVPRLQGLCQCHPRYRLSKGATIPKQWMRQSLRLCRIAAKRTQTPPSLDACPRSRQSLALAQAMLALLATRSCAPFPRPEGLLSKWCGKIASFPPRTPARFVCIARGPAADNQSWVVVAWMAIACRYGKGFPCATLIRFARPGCLPS